MSDPATPLPNGTLCPQCGYDLGGLAVGGVCPECGRTLGEADARRAVLLPAGNARDIETIPEEVREAIAIHLCSTMDDVLERSLMPAGSGAD